MNRLVAVLFCLTTAGNLAAQATATLNGTVLDQSGAAVPEVRVSALNDATGVVRRVETNASGQYTLPLLTVGQYTVSAIKGGFQPFTHKNVTLQADTTVTVDGVLSLTGTAEQITVSSEVNLVQTSATNLVQVVDSRRVVDLPLNGRNVLQLMAINAGVADRGAAGGTAQTVGVAGGGFSVPVSVNGSRGNGTNFLLDNGDNNDAYTNIAQVFPNPDAVQEFSIQTSTFDAQYGRSVGGVVNVVTKSGGNQVHGTVFNFLRNYALNAGNFFTGRDTLKRNQYGFTIGGPVFIPHFYNGHNRTFFFGSFQGTRTIQDNPGRLAIAATSAMKQGDFSSFLAGDGTGQIVDPITRVPYPNNIIPASAIDPVSRRLTAFLPSANLPNNQLRYAFPASRITDEQYLGRVDHYFSETNRLSFRYFRSDYSRPWNYLPSNFYSVVVGQEATTHNATLNHFYAFGPALINNFTVSFARTTPRSEPPGDLAVTYTSLGANVNEIAAYPTLTLNINGWTGIENGFGYLNYQNNYQISNTTSWVKGRHSLKWGGDLHRMRLDLSSYFRTGGSATFTGQLSGIAGRTNAGNAYADFLLGRVGTWIQNSYRSWRLYNDSFDLYVQDDFRVNNRLTLNLGLRYDPKFDFTEGSNRRTTFVPSAQSTRFPNAPRGLLYTGDPGVGNKIIPNDWNNFSPRVGLAYQVTNNTVIRAAYAFFYDQYAAIAYNSTVAAEPYARVATLTAPGLLANVYNGNPIDVNPFTPTSDFRFLANPAINLPGRDMRAGEMQSWNFVIERQLGGTLVRAAYVGSRGTHLLGSAASNPAIYQAGASASNVNQRRTYPGLGQIGLGKSTGWSKYHSLQLTADHRFAKGFSVLANYTWSKSIDISSYGSIEGNQFGPNPADNRTNIGPSDFDIPHRLVVSGLYELPGIQSSNRILRSVVNGWKSNGIASFQAGTPFTVLSGVDNDFNDITGDFADYLGGHWKLGGDRSKSDQIARYFDTTQFRANAIGTIGTGRRNQLRNPGLWNVDLSLFKEFSFRERLRIQFRAEAFNVFNHANFGGAGNAVNSTLFGKITTAGDPRIVQLALKVGF